MNPELSNPGPDKFQLSLELEDRLNALVLPEGSFSQDPHEIIERATKIMFNPDSMSGMGEYFGDTQEVVAQVQQGLVNSLEQSILNSEPVGPFTIEMSSEYLQDNPDPLIVAAMQNRTKYIKELFGIDELEDAIVGEHGKYITAAFDIDHPEFSWVEVSAAHHDIHGISYKFYKEKPKNNRAMEDARYRVIIDFLGSARQESFPLLISEEYPYYVGMSFEDELDFGENFERDGKTTYAIPKDIEPLLGSLAKKLAIESLVKQFSARMGTSEHFRLSLNDTARDIVALCEDPVDARNALEQLGIYEDPDNFRK